MITRIYARGFKGLDFDQPLALRTVLTGRVGSGKSSRSLALALLVTGGLPGTGIARTNGDILDAVGNGDSLTVGLELDDGTTLERAYKRWKNGIVGCEFRIAGEKCPKHLFEMELDRRGVGIADVSGFLALSDAKKVDELFRLFPPTGDVRGLSASIQRAKKTIAALESEIKGKEQSCRSLSESLAGLNLPAGSLPDVQAAIVQTEREHQAARDELTAERTRLDLERRERQAARPLPDPQPPVPLNTPNTPRQPEPALAGETLPANPIALGAPATPATATAGALERVLSALERAGCAGCAAKLVLKRELKILRTAMQGAQ